MFLIQSWVFERFFYVVEQNVKITEAWRREQFYLITRCLYTSLQSSDLIHVRVQAIPVLMRLNGSSSSHRATYFTSDGARGESPCMAFINHPRCDLQSASGPPSFTQEHPAHAAAPPVRPRTCDPSWPTVIGCGIMCCHR